MIIRRSREKKGPPALGNTSKGETGEGRDVTVETGAAWGTRREDEGGRDVSERGIDRGEGGSIDSLQSLESTTFVKEFCWSH
jgi:hypothetical protein